MAITRSNSTNTQRAYPGPSGPSASRPRRRRIALAAVAALAALTPLACSANQSPAASSPSSPSSPPSSASKAPALQLKGEGTLAAPSANGTAITYDESLAPVGAKLTTSMVPAGNATEVKFTVSGLTPNRGYAVHAHTKACGADAKAAGPHYQNRIDPAATPDKPSSDPAYANRTNEIWLDLTTDAKGSAQTATTVPFTFTKREPASIVVHKDMVTNTEPGKAGTAGDRIACLTLPKGTPANS
ncbi:MAG TPA: superoxide dismutase family protein [Pseudonocardiaceae bacterium]|jgi:Cu-Zn family superoxide dismutase